MYYHVPLFLWWQKFKGTLFKICNDIFTVTFDQFYHFISSWFYWCFCSYPDLNPVFYCTVRLSHSTLCKTCALRFFYLPGFTGVIRNHGRCLSAILLRSSWSRTQMGLKESNEGTSQVFSEVSGLVKWFDFSHYTYMLIKDNNVAIIVSVSCFQHVNMLLQTESVYRKQRCMSPWIALFIWAVLQNRREMSIYFWEMVSHSGNP